MYPSRFRYEAPRSLDDAIGLLHDGGGEAKVLAGGQSLVPLLKLRFASPELLVDINRSAGPRLPRVRTRTARSTSARCAGTPTSSARRFCPRPQPTMAAAAPLIADPIVRNRGTLVGSLCHADPQGDWASVVTALGGHVSPRGRAAGARSRCREFVTGPFQNALAYDEIAVEAVIPAPTGEPRRRLPQARAPRR